MKATINGLWQTGREIICYDDSEFDRPQTFADLKECDNVLVGDKLEGLGKVRKVLIDNDLYMVEPRRVSHPVGGTMYILEIT